MLAPASSSPRRQQEEEAPTSSSVEGRKQQHTTTSDEESLAAERAMEAALENVEKAEMREAFGAAARGDVRMVRRLVQHTSVVDKWKIEGGLRLLHVAAFYGHAAVVASLRATGATERRAEARPFKWWTPTHFAALRGHASCLRALRGSVTRRDTVNRNAFHLAARGGHTEALRELLSGEDAAELMDAEGRPNDNFGDTPLDEAAAGRHWSTFSWLLANGATLVHTDRIAQIPKNLVRWGQLPCDDTNDDDDDGNAKASSHRRRAPAAAPSSSREDGSRMVSSSSSATLAPRDDATTSSPSLKPPTPWTPYLDAAPNDDDDRRLSRSPRHAQQPPPLSSPPKQVPMIEQDDAPMPPSLDAAENPLNDLIGDDAPILVGDSFPSFDFFDEPSTGWEDKFELLANAAAAAGFDPRVIDSIRQLP